MLGAGNDFILQGFAQVAEIVAIACHPHDEVTILLGVGLSCPQGCRIDNVELNVMTVEFEIGANQVRQPG